MDKWSSSACFTKTCRQSWKQCLLTCLNKPRENDTFSLVQNWLTWTKNVWRRGKTSRATITQSSLVTFLSLLVQIWGDSGNRRQVVVFDKLLNSCVPDYKIGTNWNRFSLLYVVFGQSYTLYIIMHTHINRKNDIVDLGRKRTKKMFFTFIFVIM